MVPTSPLQVVIPGGSGHLGRILARHFHEQGHRVTVICRHPRSEEWATLCWSGYDLGDWVHVLEGADAVINLAGRNANCRHNVSNCREIKNSRTITTGLVGRAIQQVTKPPRLWMNASTDVIYRYAVDGPVDEITGAIGGDQPGASSKWRFSVDVATSWERAFYAAETPFTRKIALRSAIVMSPEPGGLFERLLRLVRWGLGGCYGSGDQYVSWIHDIDFIRAIEFLLAHDEIDGAINIASPQPIKNRDFMCCLRHAWCTTYFGIPMPEWLLDAGAAFFRIEADMVLKSRRVMPRRLLESGFDFHFPNWRGACPDLVRRWRELNDD